MSAFADYARYYDLLYRDKDYAAEGKYVAHLLREFAPDAKTILDVGCGTGAHARELAGEGYRLHGVDRSEGMLARAHAMRESVSSEMQDRLCFTHGDARSLDLGTKFDVVVSLFHVMSYQTSNDDLLSAFRSVRSHLEPGGLFLFDCWYGPAVLTHRPQVVSKTYSDGETVLERLAEPVMDAEGNTVEVKYTLNVTDKGADSETIRENHHMRYLFTPEVELLLRQNEMKLLASREWMSDKAPDFESWNVVYIVRG